MPRDAVYRYNFTSPTNGWRYRLEMIPSDDQVFLTDPGGPDDYNYEGIEEGTITVESDGEAGYDKLVIGMPLSPDLVLTLDISRISADLRTYVLSPVTAGGGFISFDGGNLREFDTLNVWSLYTDKGGEDVDIKIFEGVQKPSVETEYNIELNADLVTITLTDLNRYLLEQITYQDVALAFQSEELDGLNVTQIISGDYEAKNSVVAFDLAYGDDTTGIYGKMDVVRPSITPSGIATFAVIAFSLRLFQLESLFTIISRIADTIRTSFARRHGSAGISGTPYDALTFYKQNYSANAERGDALDLSEVWFPGFIIQTNVDDDTETIIGGFLSGNSSTGLKEWATAWDFLFDAAEAGFMKVAMKPGSLTFHKIRDAVVTAQSIATGAFVNGGQLLQVTAGYERLRACAADVVGLGDGDIDSVEYKRSGSDSEADFAIKLPFHCTPNIVTEASRDKLWSNADTSLFNEFAIVFIEERYYANKLYYFDTPSFCNMEVPILCHRTVDVDDGDGAVDYGQAYTLPTTTVSNWLSVTNASYMNRYWTLLRAAITDMQQQDNVAYAVARRVVETFSGVTQSVIEQGGFIEYFTPDLAGESFNFDPATLRSYLSHLPSTYYLLSVKPNYIAGQSEIMLLGLE